MQTERGFTVVLIGATLLGAAACWAPASDPQYITDEQGRALILHGLNVSNSAKYDSQRMPWVGPDDVARMSRDWGFNFARFLLSWDALEPAPGVYDEVYLDRVAERIEWFRAAGIYVVLDMHQDVYGPVASDGREIGGNGAPPWAFQTDGQAFRRNTTDWFLNYWQPAIKRAFDNFWDHAGHPELQDHYCAAWAHVAERFADDPIVIGYDLMNEPWSGSALGGSIHGVAGFDSGLFKSFIDRCIAAIRSADEDGWVWFEPRAWGPNDGWESEIGRVEDPREGPDRLVYFPHYYSVWAETTEFYDPSQGEDPIWRWHHNRKREIDVQRAPMLVGEWGGPTSIVGWEDYFGDFLRVADRLTSGWAYWEYGRGGWSPIDAAGNEKDPVNVLVRAYPQRIAGKPRFIDYDADARVLRLAFEEKPGVSGPTEIYIPAARFFPSGFDLSVGDPEGTWSSSWDPVREILSISTDPATPLHVVTITPND
jgi:endoglycosylceramidase